MNFIGKISLILLSILISTLTANAAGEVDLTFNASTYLNQNLGVATLAAQPDGKVLIGGNFSVVSGMARHGLARFNADGTLDGTFNPPDFLDPMLFPSIGLGGTITAIALQSTGKILVGGRFNILGSTRGNFVRLNPDGSLDASFNNGSAGITDIPIRIIVFPNDEIYYTVPPHVIKMDPNGFTFPGFQYQGTGGFISDTAVQTDGKFFVCDQVLERHTADGAVDGTYPLVVAGFIKRIVIQPDGKVLIGGNFQSVNGFAQGRVARINADGSIDLTFNENGTGANTGEVTDIAVAPDGKILISGTFTQFNGVARSKIARLNSDGTLDTDFTYPAAASATIKDVELLSSGKIMAAGTLGPTSAAPETVQRLNSDGSRDSAFAVQVTRQSRVREILQQPDSKIVVVGDFPIANGVQRNACARLNADGTLDTSFVPYFNTVPTTQSLYAVTQQSDGKILVGGLRGIVLRRLNTDGSQDTSFVTNLQASSIIYDVAALPDGKFLIAGVFSFAGDINRTIARLNANGSQDTTFNPTQPNDSVYKILQQSDGKIYIGGDFTQIGATVRGRIARLNNDGSLDTSFNPVGGANGGIYDFEVQPDGKVVAGGVFTSLNGGFNQQRIGRFNTDGSVDSDFVQTANAAVQAVKIQPDGKILIGGIMTSVGGVQRVGTARLNSNGSLDFSLIATAYIGVLDIGLQPDNKILLGGEFTEVNNVSRINVAQLLNSSAQPRPLFDFDGDAKADVSVFRPSENRWYLLRSSDLTVTQQVFAIAGDVPVPADYDGDGKTDFAIFRPSSGDWWSLSSSNGAQIYAHWGANGDIPRPSDFDGDGRADYVVFRPSNSFWYRISSGNGASSNAAFGLSGDKPVTGDFDGDGKSDKAIYRPSTGDWWYHSSLNGAQLAVHWGISTDIPAPADFDGDGKTDFCVYRPSTGVWYIINSSNFSFTIMHFGIAEDKPVPADYDGDGKADVAVFRPSTGAWYLLQSTAGFWALNWGISTDIPVENAFVP